MRLLTATAILICLSTPAFAACEHYAGHFDLEGKIGNQRNIGEASAFLPITCTQDRLLFTDLKFRADNLSNREANIGLGGRIQHEEGIAGGYIYFDRKKSGEADKFYTQITTGAEWLADHWETRANLYIPLNGAKNVSATTTTSDPYLAGSNIFIDQAGFVVKETPMHGADAEIGFQTTKNLWLYGGGFTFHGNDVPTITGARVRAKYDLTQTVSLNAEGQYDDERGRQGWLGARLSVPFGNANAARSRMTQSPVRDIDIVTQTKQQQTFQSTTPLTNPESGDAQRVIYVNNRAAANGDGSLENPYNTLADAQGDLRNYDIVYVFHGDGTTTGQDQGFVIDKDNVSFIGEGSPLTFAGYTLRAAGDKPIITNSTGNGLYIIAPNALAAGFAVHDTSDTAVLAYASAFDLGNITLDNIEAKRSGNQGFHVDLVNNSNAEIISFTNLISDAAAINGVQIQARNSQYNKAYILNTNVTDSGANGINVLSGLQSNVNAIELDNVDVKNSDREGIIISAGSSAVNSGSNIGSVRILNSTITDSGYQNINIRSMSGASSTIGSSIGLIELDTVTGNGSIENGINIITRHDSEINQMIFNNVTILNSEKFGLLVDARNEGHLRNATITNTTIQDNRRWGLVIDNDNTAADFEISATGGNRLFNNGQEDPNTYKDVRLDLNGGVIDMRQNWWGQSTGPRPDQILGQDSGANNGSALTTPWLETDPRP